MKRIVFIVSVILFSTTAAHAQQQYFFYLDRFYSPVKGDAKPYFVRIAFKQGDYWAYNDVDKKEKLIQAGFFTDTFFTKPIGHYVRYKRNGQKHYEGNFNEGSPDGIWYFYDDKGNKDSVHYTSVSIAPSRSTVVKPTDAPTLVAKSAERDSLSYGALTAAVNDSAGNRPLLKVETEASFQGGLEGWRKYLTKVLTNDMPDDISEEMPQGKYTTIVQFVVCTDGSVCDVVAISSSHPLFDLVAINAIRKGPRWNPAMQNNRNVKAYRRQPVSLVIPD